MKLSLIQAFSSNCRKPEYVPITDEIKAMFVNGHNKLRNQQALGQTGGIFSDPAADMATMVREFDNSHLKQLLSSINIILEMGR